MSASRRRRARGQRRTHERQAVAERREERRRIRKRLRELRGHLRVARTRYKRALFEARERCRADRLAARESARALRSELRTTLASERVAARETCAARMKDARALSTETARERAALAAERQLARDLRAAERADKERRRGSPACTCAKQGDDAVLASLPSDLAALYDRVKRQLKTPAGRSRTEAFLKWAESHPHDVLEATQDPAHIDLRAIEEEIAATARKLNPYEEKKAARIERMRERAAKKEAAAASSRASAQHVADRIPLGHYAERALMRRRGVVAG